jgi:hypothetical protein
MDLTRTNPSSQNETPKGRLGFIASLVIVKVIDLSEE